MKTIDPAQWQKIETLYYAAIERPAIERAAFIRRESRGDAALQKEVESLISSHELSGDFLQDDVFDLGLRVLTRPTHALKSGQTFGHYTIINLIGSGGMGEVYLAEDTTLHRRVAIKLLPENLAEQPEFKRRMFREARAAAAISHPNIAHVYEVGAADGHSYIAMEYVKGISLRKRLRAEKPLTETESLKIAVQIASALEAAHAAGIIHRDVKPENVMLGAADFVKMLDFGLAKLVENTAATDKSDFTSRGIILGTTRYMSPEQARGQAVDVRTDIWSLGVVLYEMLAGTPPFDGETKSDIIAEIIKSEPRPISINPQTAPRLQDILRRALSKNPAERYSAAGEMQRQMEDVLKGERFGNETSNSPENSENETTPADALDSPIRRKILKWLLFGVVSVACIALAVFAINSFKKKGARLESVTKNLQSPRPERLTNTGQALCAATSPDGGSVAYVVDEAGQQSIWLKQLNTGATRQIVSPSAANDFEGACLAFSPDGRQIYYGVYENESLDGILYRIAIDGNETARRLRTGIDSPVSFSPDGSQMVFLVVKQDHESLIVADADGGNARPIVTRSRPQFLSHDGYPSWSPGGKTIAFAAGTNAGRREMNVVLFDTTTGEEKKLTVQPWSDIRQLAWLPDGSGLAMTATNEGETGRQIYRITFPQGEISQITRDLHEYTGVSFARNLPKLSTVIVEDTAQIWVADKTGDSFGDKNQLRKVSSGQHDGLGITWTPDGQIVYGSNAGGGFDLWKAASNGSDRRQLTNDIAFDIHPDVSFDNRFVVFQSLRGGVNNLWRINIDGGNPVRITNGTGEFNPQISPDNQWIVFHRLSAGDSISVWKVPLEGGAPVQLSNKPTTRAAVSPDSRFVASTYRETSEVPFSIAIYSLEGLMPPVQIVKPIGGARMFVPLRWSPDGKGVVYVVGKNGVDNLWHHPLNGGGASQITHFTSEKIYSFDVSTDGKRLAVARGHRRSHAVLINLEDFEAQQK